MPTATPADILQAAYTSASQTDDQIRQVNSNLVRVMSNSAPLFAFMERNMKVSDGRARKFEFQNMPEYPKFARVKTSDVAAAGTTFIFDSNDGLVPTTMIMDPITGEQIRLTVNTSGTTWTAATRGSFGARAAAIIVVGTDLLILGPVDAEGALFPDVQTSLPTKDFNWFEQDTRAIGYSDIAEAIDLYSGKVSSVQQQNGLIEWKKTWERKFFLGDRVENTATANAPIRIMGGMRFFIDTLGLNVANAGGALTYPEFNRIVSPVATRYWKTKHAFAFGGNNVGTILSEFGLDKATGWSPMTIDTYGIECHRFKGNGWVIDYVQDDVFEDQSDLGQQLYIVPDGSVVHHIMRGMGDRWYKAYADPAKGSHTIKDAFTGVHTLESINSISLIRVENITS